MSDATFSWNGSPVPFRPGETLAAALLRANHGLPRYFCGIGACQSCVVRCDGRIVEACITLARAGACVVDADA